MWHFFLFWRKNSSKYKIFFNIAFLKYLNSYFTAFYLFCAAVPQKRSNMRMQGLKSSSAIETVHSNVLKPLNKKQQRALLHDTSSQLRGCCFCCSESIFLNTPPLSLPLPPPPPLPPPLCSAFDPTGTRSLCIPVIPAAANNQLSVIY